MLYQELYDKYQQNIINQRNIDNATKNFVPTFMIGYQSLVCAQQTTGFDRMKKCRDALKAIDGQGWMRSFHQKQFHEQFMRGCARIFWKREGPSAFTRDYTKILEHNGWDTLPQEILVSTPRRFGKTISVSMFAAAMLFSTPNVEVSIYSTCKRISQKLLRNIIMFLQLIYKGLQTTQYNVIRCNMEEYVIRGPEASDDIRTVNSYPSKVVSKPIPILLSLELIYIAFACCTDSSHCVLLIHTVRTTDLRIFIVYIRCFCPVDCILLLNCWHN